MWGLARICKLWHVLKWIYVYTRQFVEDVLVTMSWGAVCSATSLFVSSLVECFIQQSSSLSLSLPPIPVLSPGAAGSLAKWSQSPRREPTMRSCSFISYLFFGVSLGVGRSAPFFNLAIPCFYSLFG